MDNPSYFRSLPSTPEDYMKINASEARKHFDENLNILSSIVFTEAPSIKLMKKCSVRRLLSQKKLSKSQDLKRSLSLTHDDETENEFTVERSKSFSASSSSLIRANPKMSHETSPCSSPSVVTSPTTPKLKRSSFGSFSVKRQHASPSKGDSMTSVAPNTSAHHRPPLPPNSNRFNEPIGMKYKTVLRPTLPDVSIVYSSSCSVSCDWAAYITNLMKLHGYTTIVWQEVESLGGGQNQDNNSTAVILRNKEVAKSGAATAKAQIVILGKVFLDWIYTHPGSNIGSLLKDSTKVIGLLLGITREHVKAEHRTELLTFAVWKFQFVIKAHDHEHLSNSLIKAVSSMMPNQPLPYVMPRPMRKFKIWPRPIVDDKALLILNEKISPLDKIQVVVEVFDDGHEKAVYKVDLENKDIQLINEMSVEVKMPKILHGSKAKFKLEINGLYWHPQNENPVILKKQPMIEVDKYLSSYMKQVHGGAIEVEDDPKLPTILHFAVQHDMKELIKTLVMLPGGSQMATMTNADGLNARELAVHGGNLELAKLLKDPKVPRQNYELPILKSPIKEQATPELPKPREKSDEVDSNFWQADNEAYFYDIPRKMEQCYVVPPAPRPVLEPPKARTKYVPMIPTSNENSKPIPSPQSRQELLKPLRTSSMIEDLPEPEKTSENPYYVNIVEPKSPLDIVNPFPFATPEQRSSPEDRLKAEFSFVESQVINGQLSLSELEAKFKEWRESPLFLLASDTNKTEVDEMAKKWASLITTKTEATKECAAETSFRKRFRKLIKSNNNRGNKKSDSKYSTLPSMPLRLRKSRASSEGSGNPNDETTTRPRNKSLSVPKTSAEEEERQQINLTLPKSHSVSENCRLSDSDSSNSSFEK